GALSRSPLGVSGPAAGLSAVVFLAIEQLESFPIFLSTVVLCGVFQLLLGFAKAGFIGYFFPSSVIKGMLAGIGMIIILKQLPHAVGYDQVYEGSLTFAQEDGFNTFSEVGRLFELVSLGPVTISLVAFVILILWETSWIKRHKVLNAIPGPLLAVGSGILLVNLFSKFPELSLSSDQLVSLPVIKEYSDITGLFTFPDFSAILQPDVILVGITIAIIASIETLLCVEATDKLDPNKRLTPTSRELLAQGVGNITSGLLGGLPVTQVIVRSSTNIIGGAVTKTSTIFHGLWLLASLLIFPSVMNQIPLASLAIILILVGYKLTNPKIFKQLIYQGYEQFIPFLATITGILFTDLLTGVLVGLGIAVIIILRSNYLSPFYAVPNLSHLERGLRIQLAEDMSFLTRANLIHMLGTLPADLEVILDASQTRRMHPDIREVIDDFLINAETKNLKVTFIDMPKNVIIDHVSYIHNQVNSKTQKK
ncbi:SulP family inorganic anion transporter, partial [Chlamydiales bacterium]|nr:SulP family inorganic anion transporter [Chlamydiales bacterium]